MIDFDEVNKKHIGIFDSYVQAMYDYMWRLEKNTFMKGRFNDFEIIMIRDW